MTFKGPLGDQNRECRWAHGDRLLTEEQIPKATSCHESDRDKRHADHQQITVIVWAQGKKLLVFICRRFTRNRDKPRRWRTFFIKQLFGKCCVINNLCRACRTKRSRCFRLQSQVYGSPLAFTDRLQHTVFFCLDKEDFLPWCRFLIYCEKLENQTIRQVSGMEKTGSLQLKSSLPFGVPWASARPFLFSTAVPDASRTVGPKVQHQLCED